MKSQTAPSQRPFNVAALSPAMLARSNEPSDSDEDARGVASRTAQIWPPHRHAISESARTASSATTQRELARIAPAGITAPGVTAAGAPRSSKSVRWAALAKPAAVTPDA